MFDFLKKVIDIRLSREDNYLGIYVSENKDVIGKMQCVMENSSILIGDIIFNNSRYYNRGYGSKMMDVLQQFAIDNNIKEIKGNLSVVDLDHRDRLHHFYEKHGFTITIYDSYKDLYYGKVEKIIDK